MINVESALLTVLVEPLSSSFEQANNDILKAAQAINDFVVSFIELRFKRLKKGIGSCKTKGVQKNAIWE
jgi:hypothetical protein